MNIPNHLQAIHLRALEVCEKYKKSEAELLEIISKVRELKIYRYFECSSLFDYCVKILKLDPGVVYAFTTVARKITEVPELHEKIKSGSLNVSTAKRITAVLTSTNKDEWFKKAENLTMRKLEKEIAKCDPKMEVKEKASYLNSKRVRLELGMSEELMLKLRRAQDLESQRQKRSVSLEETLGSMIEVFLATKDPIEKAKRAKIRSSQHRKFRGSPRNAEMPSLQSDRVTNSSTWKDFEGGAQKPFERSPIPAFIMHEVSLRDQRSCQYVNSQTLEKCASKRFIEIHHKNPVRHGGQNTLSNLITLCSEHHKGMHLGS